MKAWMIFLMAALVSSGVMAQRGSRVTSGGAAKNAKAMKAEQYIRITDATTVGGENEYSAVPPQTAEDIKTKVKHRDSWKKDGVKGWHYFDIAYEVADRGVDASGKLQPILVLPEVEITYALLYDMSRSKLAGQVLKNAAKAGGAIGWEDAKAQRFVLLTETVTYQNIIPNREHYAAVCVPPAFVVAFGLPVCFSAEIKVNGVRQGEIMTRASSGTKIGENELASLLVEKSEGGKPVPSAWWERIQNLSSAVGKQMGVLKDRSATPFALTGDYYYDQVKSK
ncbi:MAG: hypothetical protein RSD41_04075 [Kiritimatiellia bacterium]